MELRQFMASIDYRDIVTIQKIRGMNSTGKQYVTDLEEQKMYMYDYYIQINVSSINGFKLQNIDEKEIIENKEWDTLDELRPGHNLKTLENNENRIKNSPRTSPRNT